jgi:hypothetical protein
VLPSGVLHRRLDPVEVVARIVDASIRGEPAGEIAAGTLLPARTVRDILARYRRQAPALARDLLAMTVALGGHFSFAVEIPVQHDRRAAFALEAAWARARRHGAQAVMPWHWLADISGGRVLGTNTSLPRTGLHARPQLTGGSAGRPNPDACRVLELREVQPDDPRHRCRRAVPDQPGPVSSDGCRMVSTETCRIITNQRGRQHRIELLDTRARDCGGAYPRSLASLVRPHRLGQRLATTASSSGWGSPAPTRATPWSARRPSSPLPGG